MTTGLDAASNAQNILDLARRFMGSNYSEAQKLALNAAKIALEANLQDLYASAMLVAGMASYQLSDLGNAEKYLIQALNRFTINHNTQDQIEALIAMGKVYRDQGKYDYANGMFSHGLNMARETGLFTAEADCLNGLASLYAIQGDQIKAIEALETALPLREKLDTPTKVVNLLSNLGALHTQIGQYFEALSYLTRAHQLLAETDHDPRTQGVCLISIGVLYQQLGDHEDALRYFKDALNIGVGANIPALHATALVNLGETLRIKGNIREAMDHLERAHRLSTRLNLTSNIISALNNLGHIYNWQGNHKKAQTTYYDALALARQSSDKESELDALIGLGKQYLAFRKLNEAHGYFMQALTLAENSGRMKAMANVHECLSGCFEQMGNPRAALEHFKTFHRIDQELKNEEGERRSRYLKMRFELERTEQRAEMYRLQNETNELARKAAEALVFERTQELEQSQVEIVTRLAIAAESRDDVTGAHTWRVGRNAAMLAQEIGLPREEVEIIRLAARLHDVGKIGIPDSILMKHGVLTPEEYDQMKTHTVIGGRILSGGKSRLLQLAQEIAISHHERWDGRGYPFGLMGEMIPLSGRIVAVADVFDALTHRRPYKQAWSLKNALEELSRHSGAHFDPRIVEAALRVFNNLKIVTEDAPEI